MANNSSRTEQPAGRVSPTAMVAATARLGAGVVVGDLVQIGAGVIIGRGSAIDRRAKVAVGGTGTYKVTTVGDDVHIGASARVSTRCWIGAGATIGAGAYISQGAAVPADSYVAPGAKVPRPAIYPRRPGAKVPRPAIYPRRPEGLPRALPSDGALREVARDNLWLDAVTMHRCEQPARLEGDSSAVAGAVGPWAWVETDAVVHPTATVGEGAWLGAGATLEAGAVVGAYAQIGPGVVISAGAIVEPGAMVGAAGTGTHAVLAFVGEGARVGAFAWIAARAAVGAGATVGVGAYVDLGASVPAGSHVEPGAKVPQPAIYPRTPSTVSDDPEVWARRWSDGVPEGGLMFLERPPATPTPEAVLRAALRRLFDALDRWAAACAGWSTDLSQPSRK